MANYYEKFGRNIRRVRKKQGISQEELAHRVKIDYSYMNKIENGGVNPTLRVIYRICNALSVKSNELLTF